MTVSTINTRCGPYAGNGVSTAFPVTMEFYAATDLVVIERNTTTGAETVKTLTAHYTVSGGSGGTGTVTAVAAPPAGVSWTIVRRTARTQTTAFVDADALPAAALEDGFDRAVLIGQEADDKASRKIGIPESDSTGTSVILPASHLRAGKALVFDAAGNVAVSSDNYIDQTAATAADRAAVHVDRLAADADAVATAADRAAVHADRLAADADAVATAADRLATATDKTAVHADRLAADVDAQATAADRIAVHADALAAHADRLAADADAVATAADRVATGADRTAVAADKTATHTDRLAADASAAAAAASAAGVALPAITAADHGKPLVGKPDGSGFMVGPALLVAATTGETATGTATDKAVTPAGAAATFFKVIGGTLTGWLQTYAGVDATNLGLRIGEAASGFYRSGAGVVGFVAASVEVFRTAASGAITFLRAARSAPVPLTDAAIIPWDANAGNYFTVTLGSAGAARTLALPSNITVGQSGRIVVAQDGSGNRALNYAAGFKWAGGIVGSLSTAANAVDVLYYYVHATTHVQMSLSKDFK
ncbi:hypothetical protein AZL_025360 [Azospirillum sp. B510]|uniref:hypothetical protein n=1 Tax=Azospirillum sp. (strain B510) TaxID=137722 RepID=UPI0001C4CBE6|nr:hypothetical protein [Azospirillum sp. B510]BAI73174.1 hypothetical protein AZL_025360 [Azospirillum sp. B510]